MNLLQEAMYIAVARSYTVENVIGSMEGTMKVAFNKGHLEHISGDIKNLLIGDFANLLNVVLYEKARREMEGLRPFAAHTIKWELTVEGAPYDRVVEPTTIDFKKVSMKEHMAI
jgi:hypothetical protein